MLNNTKLLIALVFLLISACSSLQHKTTGAVPLADTPQLGYTRLSDHFGIEATRGNGNAQSIKFFYIDDTKQEKTIIGANYLPPYESRQGTFAISIDGETLLFIHNEQTLKDELIKQSGLYEYKYGTGERLLDGNARSGAYIDQKMADDTIVFQRANCLEVFCIGSPTIVRSIDGKEYVWVILPDNNTVSPR